MAHNHVFIGFNKTLSTISFENNHSLACGKHAGRKSRATPWTGSRRRGTRTAICVRRPTAAESGDEGVGGRGVGSLAGPPSQMFSTQPALYLPGMFCF